MLTFQPLERGQLLMAKRGRRSRRGRRRRKRSYSSSSPSSSPSSSSSPSRSPSREKKKSKKHDKSKAERSVSPSKRSNQDEEEEKKEDAGQTKALDLEDFPNHKRSVVVSNLPEKVTMEEVQEFFFTLLTTLNSGKVRVVYSLHSEGEAKSTTRQGK